MKTKCTFAWIGALLVMVSCSPPEKPPEHPPAPDPTPIPTPIPTPHPATGAAGAAIKLYPDLGIKGSTFNRTFLELFAERRKTDPASLAKVDWPLDLARRTAGILGVSPYFPTPTPAPATARPTPATPVNSLQVGPYNQRRSVAKPPVMLDQYGHVIPMH